MWLINQDSAALRAVLQAVNPRPDETIVTLGDYVDRGLDSKGVLDELIALADRCRLIPIFGNHDQMMLHARQGKGDLRFWLECGGQAALDSYGDSPGLNAVPREHFRFLQSCRDYFQTENHLFVHANYRPDLPLDRQDDATLRWLSLRDFVPGPHSSGKTGVLGHTPHREILNLGRCAARRRRSGRGSSRIQSAALDRRLFRRTRAVHLRPASRQHCREPWTSSWE